MRGPAHCHVPWASTTVASAPPPTNMREEKSGEKVRGQGLKGMTMCLYTCAFDPKALIHLGFIQEVKYIGQYSAGLKKPCRALWTEVIAELYPCWHWHYELRVMPWPCFFRPRKLAACNEERDATECAPAPRGLGLTSSNSAACHYHRAWPHGHQLIFA